MFEKNPYLCICRTDFMAIFKRKSKNAFPTSRLVFPIRWQAKFLASAKVNRHRGPSPKANLPCHAKTLALRSVYYDHVWLHDNPRVSGTRDITKLTSQHYK